METTRFPSLALYFKALLKTGSGCQVWEAKGVLAD